MRNHLLALLLATLLAILAGPAAAATIDWVMVRDPGNMPEPTGFSCLEVNFEICGSVADVYRISRYEVTNAQYAEFLNAVAESDSYGLYHASMSSNAIGGITRSGSEGSYAYEVKDGRGNEPVVFVSWYDALRFANWLHNGQPSGAQGPATTEDGAYTFTGATSVGARNGEAITFLPTENEWFKAAFYDAVSAEYFLFPAATSDWLRSSPPPGGWNSGNVRADSGAYAVTGSKVYDSTVDYLTEVGAYTGSASPYGTYDQGGNVWEWNESPYGSWRGRRGGSWAENREYAAASEPAYSHPATENQGIGFRLASVVPEPGTGLLVMAGMLGLAAWRRRRD